MSAAACTGLDVVGKLTEPPWLISVVDVEVVETDPPLATVVGVVVDGWYPDSPCT